jgi:hypothetical protein
MLQHIALHLARSSEFPEGSAEQRYEIVAPVDASGHLDPREWRKFRTQCRVRRFSPEESDRLGVLLHHAGGSGVATWRLHYDGQCEEKGVHLETRRFAEGEYLSLRDEEGRLNTFKIDRMRPVVRNSERERGAA